MNPAISISLHRDLRHLSREIARALRGDFGEVNVAMGATAGEDFIVMVSPLPLPQPPIGKTGQPRAVLDARATATRIVCTIINQRPERPH